MAFLLAGGVCERFPELRLIFLEANGGWLVPWLERLDHHAHVPLFKPDVPLLKMDPSEYFRRQCWISFDPDESVAKAFGVPVRMGYAARHTFLVGKDGKLKKVWREVNPEGHAGEILAAAKS